MPRGTESSLPHALWDDPTSDYVSGGLRNLPKYIYLTKVIWFTRSRWTTKSVPQVQRDYTHAGADVRHPDQPTAYPTMC